MIYSPVNSSDEGSTFCFFSITTLIQQHQDFCVMALRKLQCLYMQTSKTSRSYCRYSIATWKLMGVQATENISLPNRFVYKSRKFTECRSNSEKHAQQVIFV